MKNGQNRGQCFRIVDLNVHLYKIVFTVPHTSYIFHIFNLDVEHDYIINDKINIHILILFFHW